MNEIYIYDPTINDLLSRVRGIGRYLQILHENFANECTFTDKLSSIPKEAIFINPFFNITSPPLITKRIAKRQIAVIHDVITIKYPQHFPVGIRGKINIYRNKRTLRNYDAIITDSAASKRDIISLLGIDEEKISVVYPIVAKAFHNPKSISRDPVIPTSEYCIYVGDATWNKNLVNLAKAIQTANLPCVFVGKVFSNINTTILQHPWQKELKEFLDLAKNNPLFIFPGFVPDDVLIDLYKNAICNVLVSRDEGFGFSYLEGAVSGVPSVLSDTPILHETAEDSAIFASSSDPKEIARCIQEFQSSPEKRKKYGMAAQKRSEFFTSGRFKKDLLTVCHQ